VKPSLEPLVSVVLPTHNRVNLLRDAIASIIAQTYPHWELIVVDDGSTDGTADLLDAILDRRVRCLTVPHSGNASVARNVGIAAARGWYVAFQDDDDVWLPDKLARQLAALEARPEAAWCYSDAEFVDDELHPIVVARPRWIAHEGWILEQLLDLQVGIPLPTVIVEKRALDVVGGFDERLPRRHDIDLWLRIAEHAPAAVVPARLVKVRKHTGNAFGLRLHEHGYMDATFGRAAARATSAHIRWLARRRRALMSVHFIDRFRWADRPAEAWQVAGRSFAIAWWRAEWWVAVAKTVIRPLLPQGVRAVLLARARRRTRDDG
jgi:glycosyltransferase involved in cell wall biosynthesis